jgi:hypothetical protein
MMNFIAYDEGLYPDPKNKPTRRSHKSNSCCIILPSQNEQAIAFTCRTLTKQNIATGINSNRKFRMVTRTPNTHRNPRRHVVCTATEPRSPSFIEHLHEDGNETTSERSIVVSDSTENIQALRADLQAANIGHVTPTANHDDSSFTSSESERQKPRRSSKKKKKQMKYSKRSQHKKIRSIDQGDEFSSSSDDSSSSSSSDDDSNSRSDKSQESILAFGKRGSMKNTNDITNERKRFDTSKRIGRQVKKLAAAAAARMYELKEFVISRGTIEQRKTQFLFWANTPRELLTPMYKYQALMRDFPRLDNRELTVTGNTALGLFL